MMWTDGASWGWAGWCLVLITLVVVVGGVAWAVAAARAGASPQPLDNPDSYELLARRLARGQITEAEYERQRDLISHGHG